MNHVKRLFRGIALMGGALILTLVLLITCTFPAFIAIPTLLLISYLFGVMHEGNEA
jgi:hypothetical protein